MLVSFCNTQVMYVVVYLLKFRKQVQLLSNLWFQAWSLCSYVWVSYCLGTEPLPALVSEEKVIFGLNAKAVSQITLAKIRKVYSRADNKAIAKQLGMSSHENATPIRILHNSAGHLGGPARSLGGVVIGYLGVRVFSPRPVAKMIENVGGCSVMLGEVSCLEFYTS